MYGLFNDDSREMVKNSKGVLVPYRQSSNGSGGKGLVEIIAYCPKCKRAQGLVFSTEPVVKLIGTSTDESPEFVVSKEGLLKHQICAYKILKKEISKNGKESPRV